MSNAQKIEKLKQEIAKLEAETAALEAMTPLEKLAVTIHETSCRWNHTDGCSWFYEIKGDGIHDWAGSSHGFYLSKARAVTACCKKYDVATDVATELLKLAKD
jgi:hypothetical protein